MIRPSAQVVTALAGLAAVALIIGVAAIRPTVPVPTFPAGAVQPRPPTASMTEPPTVPTVTYLPPPDFDIPTPAPGDTPQPMS